jgi:hypothetical protein
MLKVLRFVNLWRRLKVLEEKLLQREKYILDLKAELSRYNPYWEVEREQRLMVDESNSPRANVVLTNIR